MNTPTRDEIELERIRDESEKFRAESAKLRAESDKYRAEWETLRRNFVWIPIIHCATVASLLGVGLYKVLSS